MGYLHARISSQLSGPEEPELVGIDAVDVRSWALRSTRDTREVRHDPLALLDAAKVRVREAEGAHTVFDEGLQLGRANRTFTSFIRMIQPRGPAFPTIRDDLGAE